MTLLYHFLLFHLFTFAFAFTHPGLLVSQTDIDRIKTKLAAKKEPWTASWNKLTSIPFSSADYKNNAVKDINRGQNGEALWHDAAAAFNLALRWKISGEDQYADTASNILVAWADTLETFSGGDDAYLSAGLQGYQLANAAELLRDYKPFAQKGFSSVVGLLNEVFLPMNLDFLNQVLGSQHNVKHFFANWEQGNIASALAIAVVTNNQTTWDFAIDYFKNGVGNGAINNAISNIVKEPGTGTLLGQGQESGRDQGHSAMNFQLLGVIGQQAWNQGEDLFAYNNSRILLGAEYFARYNLGNDVPFEPYTNGIVSFDVISEASRGAIRPAWELLHSHYVRTKGLEAPWTTAYLNNSLEFFKGFEGGAGSWGEGSGHYDGLGWGSLLHHLDESDVAAEKPSGSSSSAVSKTSNSVVAETQPASKVLSTLQAVQTTNEVTDNSDKITSTKATQTDASAIIGLHKGCNRIRLLVCTSHNSAAGAGATFPTLAQHACSASNVALCNRLLGSIGDALHNMIRLHGKLSQIIHVPIKRLCNDWQEKPINTLLAFSIMLDSVLVDASITRSHGKAIGDDDGSMQETTFFDPVSPGHFSRAVETEDAGMAGLVKPVSSREDCCHSCIDLPALVANRLCVGEDTRHVCDAILRSRWPESKMRLWYDITEPASGFLAGCICCHYFGCCSSV
ncbi:hypothetical protein HG530_001625 [Fusarium avenaceum]|nr:hypothetical protein HG530_001625 [Fusarium avenaceum]